MNAFRKRTSSNRHKSKDLLTSCACLSATEELIGKSASRSISVRRIRLSEMGHWCCSIVGTCLSHDDLMVLARKRKVNIEPSARMFDVHGFFVTQAGKETPISRALEKLLDQRYRGMVRRVGRLDQPEELIDFWNTAVGDGQVAGAYWALLSHTHVPEELRSCVFGEVHMMSHLLGGSTQRIVGAAAELQLRLEQMERQHKRAAAQTTEALAARDAEIAELKNALAEARAQQDCFRPQANENQDSNQISRLLLKRERALIAARTKARELEAQLQIANVKLKDLREEKARPTTDTALSKEPLPRGLCGKAVLYLGGRKGADKRLHKEAASANIVLHCHDGGLDHTARQLDHLVEKCDAVVCPVTCINHQACIRAKQLCKRWNKPFMPVGSSGRGAFSRALSELAQHMGA